MNRLLLPLDLDNPLLGVCRQIAPRVKHAILHEAHETGSRLQSRELVDEQVLEFRLRDVRCCVAAGATVIVRVVVAAPFDQLAVSGLPHASQRR